MQRSRSREGIGALKVRIRVAHRLGDCVRDGLHALRASHVGTVLVHAAAGGLGLIVTQWAKALGARVIGTVGAAEEAALAIAHGADQVVLYRDEDFAEAARAFGGGVDYATDGIGGEVLRQTLGAVKPFGMVASLGQVAGDPGSISLDNLGPARSNALARPSALGFMRRDTAEYRQAGEIVLERLANGLHAEIGARVPLEQAATRIGCLKEGGPRERSSCFRSACCRKRP